MPQISKAIQENLIALLIHDNTLSHYIRANVSVNLYEGLYRDIAKACYGYLEEYGSPPRVHIYDLLEESLASDDKRSTRLKHLLLDFEREYEKGSFNLEFIEHQLKSFVSEQSLTSAIVEAGNLLQSDDPNKLNLVQDVLTRSLSSSTEAFDLGKSLKQFDISSIVNKREADTFPTGIKSLDKEGLGPARGELHIFLALPNRGKSWWLVNVGRRAAQRGQKVLHVTLEMSADSCALRYMQCLFAMYSGQAEPYRVDFEKDEKGKLIGLDRKKIRKYLSTKDPEIQTKLNKKLNSVPLGEIKIKQFPSGTLTVGELYSYLKNIENIEGFIPDLIIIDYPDLMYLNQDRLRTDLGRIFVELRGLAVRMNAALATATQSNREGVGKKLITSKNVSEDFSKIMTADTIITYNQTDAEEGLNLARLYVEKSRMTEARQKYIVSQNYSIGQFVLDDVRMLDDDKYYELIDDNSLEYEEDSVDDTVPTRSPKISRARTK